MSSHWNNSYSSFAETHYVVAIPLGFIEAFELHLYNPAEFVLQAQNGMYSKSCPEIVDVLSNIQRYLTMMDTISFVRIQQRPAHEDDMPRNRTRGDKCETVDQVCAVLARYIAQQRHAVTGSSGDMQIWQTAASLVLKPWIDISTGCEFKVYIDDTKVQSKGYGLFYSNLSVTLETLFFFYLWCTHIFSYLRK